MSRSSMQVSMAIAVRDITVNAPFSQRLQSRGGYDVEDDGEIRLVRGALFGLVLAAPIWLAGGGVVWWLVGG